MNQAQKITLDFCKRIPKVELHAHLGGSLRRSTLQDLLKQKNIDGDYTCFLNKDMAQTFQIFDLIYKGLQTLDDIKRITQEVLEDFMQQNVAYFELRSTPKQTGNFTQEQYLDLIFEEIIKFNEKNSDKMTVRFILSIDRSKDYEEAVKRLQLFKQYQQHPKYGKYLVGLDYCGNPMKNDFSIFRDIFQKAKDQGIKITIHCAELDDEKTLNETYNVLDFQPHRLGHFNYHNQELFDQVLAKKIPIEMCPTSNKYTMNLKDYKDHHFINFYKQNHPISLNTDDTCCFNQNLSEEYYNIATAFDLNQQDLRNIALSSASIIFDQEYKSTLINRINNFFDSQ